MLVGVVAAVISMDQSAVWEKRGLAVLEQIRRDYYLPKTRLYSESVSANGKKSGPSFNWGAGVMLSALNAAARADAKYKPWLREYADATRAYWNPAGPVPGYDASPFPKDTDRYYDDNAWMVLALAEAYDVLGDRRYLRWAEEALAYALSGWDDKLGGGIYWREKEKKSKNTCSNVPTAAACLAIAKRTGREELRTKAREIVRWTRAKLQDPTDGLFWDNMSLAGKVDKTKWTYNTALYLRCAASMNELEDADRVVQSSVAHWMERGSGAIRDEGKFAHLWLEGLIEVRPNNPRIVAAMEKALGVVWRNRTDKGIFGHRWEKPAQSNDRAMLLDQASAARAFLFFAACKKS